MLNNTDSEVDMLMTFATVLAVIYAIGFSLMIVGLFIQFWNLTPRQQQAAKINVNGTAFLGFLVAVSFLIARVIG